VIIKQHIKLIIFILSAILLTAGAYFYRSSQTYSCSGQQKVYLDTNEFINVRIKINSQPEKFNMTVKGIFHHADGTKSEIYRQGSYQYSHLNSKLYEAKLLSAKRVFTDTLPEQLSNNIFGVQPGESRNFRMKKLRNGLIMFGTEYTWFYACRLDV